MQIESKKDKVEQRERESKRTDIELRMGLRKINGMNKQFKRGPNKEKECRYRKERKIE